MDAPKPSDRYQHFKGTVYEVVGVTESPTATNETPPDYVATHTETEELLLVWQEGDRFWAMGQSGRLIKEQLVLYWDLETSDKMWARPLENSLETLSSGTSDRCQRFTKVGADE